ncbi:MAG TPA: diphthine synthase [Candidatus Woesearchaeota archaeon]|jgi:diphthine synthase|nr:diphthine synthase [Candidatus Woesearchaeota archaeon]
MTLNLIGIGLGDKNDITLKGLEIIKKSNFVFLDSYTSMLVKEDINELELIYQKKIIVCDREKIESDDNVILNYSQKNEVSLLIIGDVFVATTHIDLFLRAKKLGIKVNVINNSSILTAVGVTGLSLYKFGHIGSIVFPEENWLPKTPYDILIKNQSVELHTLFLLDIKRNESVLKNYDSKDSKKITRFMTIKQALEILLLIEDKEKKGIISKDTYCIGIARLGFNTQKIVYGPIHQIKEIDFGSPLHCLIFPSRLHFIEEEALMHYLVK